MELKKKKLTFFIFVSDLTFYITEKNIVQKGMEGQPLICQKGNQVKAPEVALPT
jgi:hypothetical protein